MLRTQGVLFRQLSANDVNEDRNLWYPVAMNILGDVNNTTNIIVPTNEGVTAAIVAFLFVCLVFPSIVKNRQQYYAALGAILIVIFLHAIGAMIKAAGFIVFEGFVTALLQIGAIVMLVLCVGGLTARDLADDVIEVVRRRRGQRGDHPAAAAFAGTKGSASRSARWTRRASESTSRRMSRLRRKRACRLNENRRRCSRSTFPGSS